MTGSALMGVAGAFSPPVGLQRVLLQHGERPWLDLRRAGRIRLVALRQGLARGRCCSPHSMHCSSACSNLQAFCRSPALPALPHASYLLSIVALVVMARRAAYPQALMKPYRKGER